MKRDLGHSIRLHCSTHDGIVERAPQHCTLTLNDGELTLVGLCPDCGVTASRAVFGLILPSIRTLPVLLDPDVRDLLDSRKANL